MMKTTLPKLLLVIFAGILLIFFVYTYGFDKVITQKLPFMQTKKPVQAVYQDTIQTTSRLHIYNASSIEEAYSETKLKYSKGSAFIYLYPPKKDIVSDMIRKSGSWEGWITGVMEKWFDKDPDLQLIDIGSNIGAFTIIAAMRGRRVVAVDPNINNIKMTRKAVLKNKVDNLVTLLWNGASDRYDEFTVKSDSFNVGDSNMIKPNKNVSKGDLVKSIYVDDMLKVIPFKKAMLKIDIEGHEHEALDRADQLFTKIEIPGVFMEWRYFTKDQGEKLLRFFAKHGYTPCLDLNPLKPLDLRKFTSWPYDMTWLKKSVS